MQSGPRKNKKKYIQPIGNREEPHPRNWKQTGYHKIKQRLRICHLNLKRKRKQNSSNYMVTRLSTIRRKGLSRNSSLRQNQPNPRPDLHPRLLHPGFWRIRKWAEERAQPSRCEKSNLNNNQKHFLYSNTTNSKKKRTTEIHRNTGEQAKTKVF